MKNKIKVKLSVVEDNKRSIDTHFRLTFKEYEYLKRWAYDSKVKVSDLIRQCIYHENWRRDLRDMRVNHGIDNIEDEQFYHSTDPRNDE